MTVHHLQHIVDLVEICRLKKISHVVISPGSRNAPLTRLFTSNSSFICHSIVDERSAAFYGLGISLGTGKPVALVCTSGTAVLNYAPAIAEAFYQHVPLIAITADRPKHLIDQQDNQTIHQADVYHNYIKGNINLEWPIPSEIDLKQQHQAIAEILDFAVSGVQGPIQINVPISEPLYEALPKYSTFLEISDKEKSNPVEVTSRFLEIWKNAQRRMVLCGQNSPDETIQQIISGISEKAVVLAEPISNVKGAGIISAIDRVMMRVGQSELTDFQPDLLISFGGPVVSKRLKQWLQKQPNLEHWRISKEPDDIDTYQNRKELLIGDPTNVLAQFSTSNQISNSEYLANWRNTAIECFVNDKPFFNQTPFSDSLVFHFIMNQLTENCTLHFGNSSPVRYGQLYTCDNPSAIFSNRGVSGIDGSLSTASGIASVIDGLHLVIIGDLSFVYDSNALWNRNLSKNLRIVVINNSGGGIFRLLPGPSEQECFEAFMETQHPAEIQKLAQAFGVNYFQVENQLELEQTYHKFIQLEGPSILEIKTMNTENPVQFKAHIQSIKSKKTIH